MLSFLLPTLLMSVFSCVSLSHLLEFLHHGASLSSCTDYSTPPPSVPPPATTLLADATLMILFTTHTPYWGYRLPTRRIGRSKRPSYNSHIHLSRAGWRSSLWNNLPRRIQSVCQRNAFTSRRNVLAVYVDDTAVIATFRQPALLLDYLKTSQWPRAVAERMEDRHQCSEEHRDALG